MFVALVIFVPLVYLLVAVAVVQRTQLAVADAAREAGRAYATSDSASSAPLRAATAVRLALAAHGVTGDGVTVRFVTSGTGCTSPAVDPSLAPGAQFAVCVIRHVDVPGVPSFVGARGITAIGAYTVHVDDFRAVAR